MSVTAKRTGSRRALPSNSDKVCAVCGEPRGNRTAGWTRVLRNGAAAGWTCPACPTDGEPITRVLSRGVVRWRARVDTVTTRGDRRQLRATFDTLDAARSWVADAAAARREGRPFGEVVEQVRGETVSELCDRWLAGRLDVRAVTREGYAGALASVRRCIGDREVTTLTSADMRELVSWLSREGGRPTRPGEPGHPLSPRAVRAGVTALAQALDLAVEDGLLARNPARGVKLPRQAAKRGSDLEHWQPSDLLTFRDAADHDVLAGAWRLTLCGMSRADVMGLRWSDVDLDAGTVTVRQGRVQLQRGGQRWIVDEPKSAQRRRLVPIEVIHPGTVALLRQLRARQAAEQLAGGEAYTSTGFVVVDGLGHPMRPELYSDRFRRLCQQAGVPVIHLHSVRHSLAFWLHSLGVTPADAAALLGHTVEVHLATYLPESGATGIAAAADALGRVSGSLSGAR